MGYISMVLSGIHRHTKLYKKNLNNNFDKGLKSFFTEYTPTEKRNTMKNSVKKG